MEKNLDIPLSAILFIWYVFASRVGQSATNDYPREADCLRIGDILFLGNPLYVGVKRLHLLAASRCKQMLDQKSGKKISLGEIIFVYY